MNIPFTPTQDLIFSAKIKVENLQGGSRGWGFWNTNAIPVMGMKTAWFMQLQGKGEKGNGFFAQTFSGLGISSVKLPDLDENWHEYQIVMNNSLVEYFIDGISVASVSDPSNIPNGPLAFHNWVDNAFFDSSGKKILQVTTASRSNHTQYMRIRTGN